MRGYGKRSEGPPVAAGIAIFVALLVLLQLLGSQSRGVRPLEQQFAARPPEAGAARLELPPLPSSVAAIARTARARIGSGVAAPPLTPVARGATLQVEITGIRKVASGLRVTGWVANTGERPLPVGLAAFQFGDGSGMVYTAEGDTTTTLQPGQRAPLDLLLPMADARHLTLEVEVEGEQPLRMVLLQTPD